jgi:hypothetical protein
MEVSPFRYNGGHPLQVKGMLRLLGTAEGYRFESSLEWFLLKTKGVNSGLRNRKMIGKPPTWWEDSILGNRKTDGKIPVWWEISLSGRKRSSVAWIIQYCGTRRIGGDLPTPSLSVQQRPPLKVQYRGQPFQILKRSALPDKARASRAESNPEGTALASEASLLVVY